MATLGSAYVQIVPSAQGISGSIQNVLDPEASAAGTSAGGKIASFAKKAIIAAGVGTALVKGIQASMAEGGKLQQSYMGGLDTIYGKAADSARGFAKEAAKAGISMNTYSEQAVSFGAALRQAYGGDTTKAVNAANTAILDMADNQAKMGTDITMIQNAYQGFAKQNYTMLDNLKLGYGGTKTEMQRLLKDAEALSGREYDISNLGDVYEAIHVIQGELGLTGVAAAEAEGTFTGSFASMKAAAQNFLGELALGMDVTDSLNVLVTSANTFFFSNFLPMIGNIVKALPGAIATFLQQGLPTLISSVTTLITTLTTAIEAKASSLTGAKVSAWASKMLPKILAAGARLVGQLASSLVINLPKIVAAVGRIGLAIVKGLGSSLWGKISAAANGIRDRFMAPINAIVGKVKATINKVKRMFPFKVGKIMSGLKLPHFSITGKFSLNPPSIPKVGVKWYATGGIIDGATILGGVGLGEAGPEAILPLNPFWSRMDRLEERLGNTTGTVTINVYASPGMNVRELASEVEQRIVAQQKQRRAAWGY